MIYLDNAATTRPKPPGVAEAVAAAMNDYGNSGRGTHPEALEAARSIYGVRQALAALFGCSRADRVAFTPNSTMALNIAISGLLGAGDHVISTDLEHNSVLRPLYRLRAQGGAVDFVPADRQGRIDYEDFERLLRPNTKAVVCTHGSNLTGDLMDIQRVGNFCQKHRLLFILDASQTAGVFPIDMERQHISVVSFTGHKSLMGPQGTGGLCVGAGVEIRPLPWAAPASRATLRPSRRLSHPAGGGDPQQPWYCRPGSISGVSEAYRLGRSPHARVRPGPAVL